MLFGWRRAYLKHDPGEGGLVALTTLENVDLVEMVFSDHRLKREETAISIEIFKSSAFRRGKVSREVRRLHDNGRVHSAPISTDTFRKCELYNFYHPPYTPVLTPSNSFFSKIKDCIKGILSLQLGRE